MSVHHLKCWPESFAAVLDGTKSFEWRRDDRGFEAGDELLLEEFLPHMTNGPGSPPDGRYTGRSMSVRVTHILRAPKHGVPEGFVVMSICRLPRAERLQRYFFGGRSPA